GGVRRAALAMEPFRVASYDGARRAMVFHDRVPCDFLAWEHMSWECSHFDAGLYGMVGLAVSDPIRVGGERREMMIVPTGRSGQERRVIWPEVRAGRRLVLRWAVPDGMRGDGVLVVRVDDREVASIEVPAHGDGVIEQQAIDTREVAGRTARLELSMRPEGGRRHQATVAVDAIWE
ncbi:MAG: hypothetical protein M3Y87_35740, partial [Myxococcota bacterium]|nr:hypothetical protein [Myxococcota bacterium]